MAILSSLPFKYIVLFLAYVVAGRIGLLFDPIGGFATLIWAPTGIAFAGIYKWGYRVWPAILLGAFTVNFLQGGGFEISSSIALGNTFEALIGVYAFRKFSGDERSSLESLRSVFAFLFFAVFLSTSVSATFGTFTLWIAGRISPESVYHTWCTWWLGDIVGNLIVAPIFVANFKSIFSMHSDDDRPRILIALEVISILLFAMVINFIAYSDTNSWIRPYFVYPLLLWAGLRAGQFGVVVIIGMSSAIAIYKTCLDLGPFARDILSNNLFRLQSFMAVFALTGLIWAAILAERKKTNRLLKEARDDLEVRVCERTRQLQESLEIIRDLYDNSPCGYHSVDIHGVIVEINNTELSWLGYERSEVIHKMKIKDLLTPESQKIYDAIFARFLETGFANDVELEIIRKDGSILPVLMSKSAIYDRDNKYVMSRSTLVDLTERKQAEEHRSRFFLAAAARQAAEAEAYRYASLAEDNARLYQQAQEAIQARDEFFSIASHDLRAPVRSLAIQLHLFEQNARTALRESFKGHELSETFSMIQSEIKHLAALLDNFLDVIRSKNKGLTFNFVSTDLSKLTNEITGRFKGEAQDAGSDLRVSVEENVVGIWDTIRLQQVIVNLLSNAIKYGDEKPIEVSLEATESTAILCIKDHGRGIDKVDHGRIFNRFEQALTHRAPSGLGLGLYISKIIVESHGGTITVESALGRGATFKVILPRKIIQSAVSASEIDLPSISAVS